MIQAENPWQVTASSHPTVSGVFRLVMASLLLMASPAAIAGRADPLREELSFAVTQLNKAWRSDPVSRELPFPRLEILVDAVSIPAACPDRPAPHPAPSRAVYCPSRGTILIDASAFEAESDALTWPLRYWIAIGLAEAINLRPRDSGTRSSPRSPAVSSLENHCIAGVLLAASGLTAGQPAALILAPALSAYPVSKAALFGSQGQRGYALLTGLGATELSCAPIDMLALSQNRVPDPDVLKSINPPRASSSLMAVLNSQCRPRPRAACPRRLIP
jgi:hypothetical protein